MISVKALILSALTDARKALAVARAAGEPLMPYLVTLRRVFIAVALLRIGVADYTCWDDWPRAK